MATRIRAAPRMGRRPRRHEARPTSAVPDPLIIGIGYKRTMADPAVPSGRPVKPLDRRSSALRTYGLPLLVTLAVLVAGYGCSSDGDGEGATSSTAARSSSAT